MPRAWCCGPCRATRPSRASACTSTRWADTAGEPYCPRCGCVAVYGYTTRRLWKCKGCGHQFSATSGTIFAGRKLAMRDYLLAIAIFCNGAKGVSALQLSRDLDVQYKTAFVLAHSGADNFRPDVAKVETLLGDAGYYKPLTNDGPNGWHNSNLDQAIRSFQEDKGLEVDGFLKPGGPTIGKIGSLLGGSGPQGSAKPSDPWEVKVGGRNPGDPNTLKPPAWWQAVGDGDGDGEDPEPFPGQPRLPSPVPPGGEPVPPAGLGVNHFVEHRPTQEQMDQYQAEYKKWVQDNWDAIQKNQELKRQGLPTIPLPPPPRNPREGIPGVLYAVDPAGATSSPAGKPDPFPNHTINQEGIDGNQAYAEMRGRDSDPSQTARMLKRAIDDYGDQGRGDVADLLARFKKIDGTKAEDLRRELHKATGEILPYRLAPLGEGFREPTDEERIAAVPKTPFGSTQGADRWAADTMADALLGKGDYADAITHF